MVESKFQTTVDIQRYPWQTGYSKKNVFMGSCFTENVGNRMADLKYDVDINPFGILYNPDSVANGIRLLIENKEFKDSDLTFHNGLWHSFSHHGRFSNRDKNEALNSINSRIKYSSVYLREADFLLITFGTAWIYKSKSIGKTVSNCHKIPAKQFERTRLSVEEIVNKYSSLLADVVKLNRDLKIIFTVSPIRHWKDGAIENQRSKATLLLAIDQIINTMPDKLAYFPSYEIVMDELRDYRFYTEDMLHISNSGINHIWERFNQSVIDEASRKISEEVGKIVASANHRPLYKFTKEHLNFLEKQATKLKLFEQEYPFVDLKSVKQNFKNQIDEIKSIVTN